MENPNNVPSVDMSDILNEESNKSTGMEEATRYIKTKNIRMIKLSDRIVSESLIAQNTF